MTILVAEDDNVTQRLLRDLLCHFGYDVECVDDGEQAVAAMGRQSFELVLMDVLMPVMNGIDAVRLLRQTFADVPVIMMTAYEMEAIAATCIDAGANDVIEKPVPMSELRRIVDFWMVPEMDKLEKIPMAN